MAKPLSVNRGHRPQFQKWQGSPSVGGRAPRRFFMGALKDVAWALATFLGVVEGVF